MMSLLKTKKSANKTILQLLADFVNQVGLFPACPHNFKFAAHDLFFGCQEIGLIL